AAPDSGHDRLVRQAEQPSRGNGTERVLDVEAPSQLEVDALEGAGADLGVVGEAERQRVGTVGGEPAPPRVADVDRSGRPALEEQAPLRVEVALHRPVEVEVVLAQVGEDERGGATAVKARRL